jgi:hypothetical protein
MRTDQGFVRRHKAVLRTGPLLALDAGKLQRGPEWAAYELVGLALVAINAIIAHSVLAHGAPVAEVHDELREAVLAVTPDADDARVDAVVDAVLGMLLNERDRRNEMRVDYGDWSGEAYVARWFPFWMVKEHEPPAGGKVFVISEETVNLYLNAFDVDLADHQAFIEGLTRSQLARGRIDKAAASAEQALLVSRAYALSIDRIWWLPSAMSAGSTGRARCPPSWTRPWRTWTSGAARKRPLSTWPRSASMRSATGRCAARWCG